jgi:hypothetical protein
MMILTYSIHIHTHTYHQHNYGDISHFHTFLSNSLLLPFCYCDLTYSAGHCGHSTPMQHPFYPTYLTVQYSSIPCPSKHATAYAAMHVPSLSMARPVDRSFSPGCTGRGRAEQRKWNCIWSRILNSTPRHSLAGRDLNTPWRSTQCTPHSMYFFNPCTPVWSDHLLA